MAVALKLLVIEELLIVQLTIETGLTVTTTFCVPLQPLALNVYTYVTLTGELVVLTRVSLILPVPLAAALLIPATVARLHAKVVPAVALAAV